LLTKCKWHFSFLSEKLTGLAVMLVIPAKMAHPVLLVQKVL